MSEISMRELFEVGAHFGHQKRFWNPNMHNYVYGVRNGSHIINLEKTVPMLKDALNFVSKVVAGGGTVLFVGTKRTASKTIREQAERCGMPYVSHRWLGGMLTNFKTIKQSINRLKELESQKANNVFDRLTKKEALMRTREMEKLERNLSGIKNMEGMPDIIFVMDVRHEKIAISEAKAMTNPISVVGIVDTNSSPQNVDYVIPANDDAARAIEYYTRHIADAVINANRDIVEEKVFVGEEGAPVESEETVELESIVTEEVTVAELEEAVELDKEVATDEASVTTESEEK